MQSKHIKKQISGGTVTLRIEYEEYFSITIDLDTEDRATIGPLFDLVEQYFPEFSHLTKWHLFSLQEPVIPSPQKFWEAKATLSRDIKHEFVGDIRALGFSY